MVSPIPQPKTYKFYSLLTMVGTKFTFMMNVNDVLGTGLWATREEAQQQQLIETIKNPSQKYEVYEIEWPVT